ncbi:flagellar FliL protein [Methylomagnum ishizawai]|uniref:Flagellar protein FliL n=1 Tax=Methylomagnum ishizawai TaxID=1760988 RepID=A0A1Y6DAG9_9GAMM|nr:flagellar basal body-associated FliL family protein [Methylomagnum ishizawai]SMF97174.1 flagellar FliL protein [Methylomagnum ishizawai]
MAEKDKLDLGEERKTSSVKKLAFIVLGAVLGTLIAVFAALYFLGIFPPKAADGAAPAGQEATAAGHDEHGAEKTETAEAAEHEGEEEDHGKHKKGKHGEHDEAPTLYQDLEPAFVVNFQGSPDARVLQVSLSIATDDASVVEAVKKHSPMIRNNLLMLMSAEDPAALKTTEGKEALRAKLLEEINAIIKKQARKRDAVDEVYFTAFVMQ